MKVYFKKANATPGDRTAITVYDIDDELGYLYTTTTEYVNTELARRAQNIITGQSNDDILVGNEAILQFYLFWLGSGVGIPAWISVDRENKPPPYARGFERLFSELWGCDRKPIEEARKEVADGGLLPPGATL